MIGLESNLGFAAANNIALKTPGGASWCCSTRTRFARPIRCAACWRSARAPGSRGGRAEIDLQRRVADDYRGTIPSPLPALAEALDPLRLTPCMRARLVHVPSRQEQSRIVDYVMGACFLMPRSALDTVGPLDESFFMYFEETDWCWRARQAGLDGLVLRGNGDHPPGRAIAGVGQRVQPDPVPEELPAVRGQALRTEPGLAVPPGPVRRVRRSRASGVGSPRATADATEAGRRQLGTGEAADSSNSLEVSPPS